MTEQNTTQDLVQGIEKARKEIADNWGWFVALGVISVIVGVLAIIFPLASSIATKIILGWVLLIAGIAHIIHAFSDRNWRGFIADVLLGLLFIIAGGWLAFFPIAGLLALTVFVAVVFMVQGIFEIILAFQTRGVNGWVFILISGIIALAAGFLVWNGLPSTAAWVIGVLAGINLISSGLSYIMIAMMSRKEGPATA
jgi:uncharacterized membrane protein HdeD (DUF308 family)